MSAPADTASSSRTTLRPRSISTAEFGRPSASSRSTSASGTTTTRAGGLLPGSPATTPTCSIRTVLHQSVHRRQRQLQRDQERSQLRRVLRQGHVYVQRQLRDRRGGLLRSRLAAQRCARLVSERQCQVYWHRLSQR